MSLLAYLLVAVSAITHAYWNYLVKRSGGGQLFVGLSKVVEAVLWAPFFVILMSRPGATPVATLLPFAAVGAALTLAVYVLLAVAYQHGDLSLVYPVSRGGTLLFLPIIGALFLDEHVSGVAILAFLLILAGILIIQLRALSWDALRGLGRRFGGGPATAFALVTSLFGAIATAWDKHSVQSIPPLIYFYGYTALVAVSYVAFVLSRHGGLAIRAEWRRSGAAIVQVGVLNTVSYGLVLFALQLGTASYIVATRQLSVAFGALLGWRLLGESFGRVRIVAVTLLLVGSVLVAFAR